MLKQLIIRLAANGLGIWISAELIAGISYGGDWVVLAVATLIFSLVNALLRPILVLLTLPAIILTLGLFTLLINGFLLWLVTWLYPAFSIDTFGAAVVAVIIIWVVNHAVNTIVPGK